MIEYMHKVLPCGVECGVVKLPRRRIVSFQVRVFAGACNEPEDKLGLARLVAETIDKGTNKRSGRELFDAFDAIGASYRTGSGRETFTCTCTVLPEHFEKALALHAEFLRTPTFPEEASLASIELGKQERLALDDDAHALASQLIGTPALGPLLGRHPLGELDTLERIQRDDLERFWKSYFTAGRMLVAAAGPLEGDRAASLIQQQFDGFGSAKRNGRDGFAARFTPGTQHHEKDLQQEHMAICWPGVPPTHPEFPTQQVILGILSGGMSGRLFTEVREKQGLVYSVSAWHEAPRGTSRIFLGASTTPERSAQTYATLLREVNRLAHDIEDQELERAVTGILAAHETRGDSTRAHCHELANDLLVFGRPRSDEEKIAEIRTVTIDRIRKYLTEHPRDQLCVLTLGPRRLDNPAESRTAAPATVSHP